MSETPSWGIEPVPDRLRVLGLVDSLALWGNLGISLLVIVAGTYLVPGLSLKDALLAVLVGGLIGNAMLGAAGAIGAQARVPSMVLLRAPLGRRGTADGGDLDRLEALGAARPCRVGGEGVGVRARRVGAGGLRCSLQEKDERECQHRMLRKSATSAEGARPAEGRGAAVEHGCHSNTPAPVTLPSLE